MRVPTHPARPGWSRAHGTRTRQRSLVLCQVKDLVETALLGAVEAAGVFVLAQAGGRTGHAAPRGGRLQLPTAPRPRQPGQHGEGRGWHSHRRPPCQQHTQTCEQARVPSCGALAPPQAPMGTWAWTAPPAGQKPRCSGGTPFPQQRPHPKTPHGACTPAHADPGGGLKSELVMGQATRSSVRK